VNVAPEYDECAKAAHKHDVPLKMVMDEAKKIRDFLVFENRMFSKSKKRYR
jgi:uncharacterized protein (DUF111 family)